MGLYSNRIFPWIIEYVMSRDVMTEQRDLLLTDARGEVLEIGFGTGLNLAHYPGSVERLTIVDPNAGMHRRAAERIAIARFDVQSIQLGADDHLPINEGQFDTVVSTWTMCSIANLPLALAELSRVLKPGGRLLFVEHGLSPEERVARWQNRLNGINRRIGDGCNLNRDIARLVSDSPLSLLSCEQFYLPKTPRIGAWTYRGIAEKPG